MKFRRVKINPQPGQFFPHPEGTAGIGVHALESDRWMTLEEIMDAHRKYFEDNPDEYVPPTWGELIRDLGLFICFHMVEVNVNEYDDEDPESWSDDDAYHDDYMGFHN